jgi:aspartate kinase
MDSLRDFHLDLVFGLISNDDLKRTVSSQIQIEIEKLRSFLAAAEIIDEISARSRDIIISTGEKLSARILTALLLDRGINAKYVCLDNLVKDKSWNTKPLDQKFYDYLIHELSQLFSSNVFVPVVTGYLGMLI